MLLLLSPEIFIDRIVHSCCLRKRSSILHLRNDKWNLSFIFIILYLTLEMCLHGCLIQAFLIARRMKGDAATKFKGNSLKLREKNMHGV